jgi:hypothetical protein
MTATTGPRPTGASRQLQTAKREAADAAAQERGPAGALPPMRAVGYVHVQAGAHPDHDDAVLFLPGELLPSWVVALLDKQHPDHQRVDHELTGRRRQPREVTS